MVNVKGHILNILPEGKNGTTIEEERGMEHVLFLSFVFPNSYVIHTYAQLNLRRLL